MNKNEKEDIKAVLGLNTMNDKWKLNAISQIVEIEDKTTAVPDAAKLSAEVENTSNDERNVAKNKHKGPYRTKEKNITKEDLLKMHEAFEKYGDNADVREALCKELGRSYSSISNMAHRYKHGKYYKRFKLRPTNKKRKAVPVTNSYKKVTNTEVDTIIREKFINGNSINSIAKLLGRTKGSVSSIIWQVQHGKRQTSVKWKPNDSETVEVGDDGSTKMPKKFKMFG